MARKVGPPETAGESARPSRVRLWWGCGALGLVVAVALGVTLYWCLKPNLLATPCSFNLSVPIVNGTVYPNGSLVERGDVYPPGYYFTVNGTTRGCLCALKPCIRKCCSEDEFINFSANVAAHCEKNPKPSAFNNFTLPVYKNVTEFANISQKHFRILYGDVCAYGKFLLMPSMNPDDRSYLMYDGRILLTGNYLDASEYCLESVDGFDGIQTLVCFPPSEDNQSRAAFTFYPLGMIMSIPFLLGTFLVYAVISELRNLHGKSLMCHVFSLLSAYVVLTVVQLGRDAVPPSWCFGLAFVIQFSFLATFFWLNVMCFDIWWVFSGLKPLRGSVKEREHKKFILYSLYAWGGPLLILAVSLFMETAPFVPDSFIKPRFGIDKCWFKDWDALALYFYLPIGVLILLNIVMFVTTAFRLRAHTKDTKVLKSSESRRTDDNERQRFNLYLKLFIVMGINWVMELVSFAVGGPKYIWFLTDIGNTLQGLLIFLIFVCKRRILRMLNQKLCPQWKLVGPATTSARSKVSDSRTSSLTLSKTPSNNPEGVALKPLATTITEDSDS